MIRSSSPIIVDGKYDYDLLYKMVIIEKNPIASIEYKYGITRNDILACIEKYNEEHLTQDYLKNIQKGDLISFKYIYEFNFYFIIGTVIKKNINSLVVQWVDGDELPSELMNIVVVATKESKLIKKNSIKNKKIKSKE